MQADSLPSDPTYKPQERSISIYKDIHSRLRRITKAQFLVYGLKHSSLISLNSREIAAPAQAKTLVRLLLIFNINSFENILDTKKEKKEISVLHL